MEVPLLKEISLDLGPDVGEGQPDGLNAKTQPVGWAWSDLILV
jgi:hypothetical protein